MVIKTITGIRNRRLAKGHHINKLLLVLVLSLYTVFFLTCIGLQRLNGDAETLYALHDDAMISMRYAYNLAHGEGLVWNPGEHVEGMTNLLWTVYMAVFFVLGISPATVPLAILLSNLILNLVTLMLVWRVGQRKIGNYALIAVVTLCFSLPF
jgi:hypothetical protein